MSDSFADRTYAILGGKQPTATTARIADGKVTCYRTYEGDDLYGDATVPMVGGARKGLTLSSNTLHHVTEQHTSLQDNAAVLDMVESFLTATDIVPRNVDRHGTAGQRARPGADDRGRWRSPSS